VAAYHVSAVVRNKSVCWYNGQDEIGLSHDTVVVVIGIMSYLRMHLTLYIFGREMMYSTHKRGERTMKAEKREFSKQADEGTHTLLNKI